MDNLTEQDLEHIEIYNSYSTEHLFYAIGSLHLYKIQTKAIDPIVKNQVENTISLLRDILIERNAVN